MMSDSPHSQYPPSHRPEGISYPFVKDLDEFVANASPAAIVQVMDGWLLRWNWGVTRRANSVLASGDLGRVDVATKLQFAEEFYRRRGLRPRFQVSPATPPALVALLDQGGYNIDASTFVQTATVSDVFLRTAGAPSFPVELTASFSDAWLAIDTRSEGEPQHSSVRRGMLERIGPRTSYALLRIDGTPAAVSLAVLERGWVGVYAVATLPQFRRRGASTVILRALAQWAEEHGAMHMYLAVMERNRTAQSVYERAGFRTSYSYHYREVSHE
jgi:ribosomal protein S18 acetylase RimI-like enzyme